jgi:hypothetical protein
MSTASIVLLAAGLAASLAGVWALSGLSERSSLRGSPRVLLSLALGLSGLAGLYRWAPVALRADLSLPIFFGTVSVLGVAVGGAKLDGALAEKNGPRALRRAAGLVLGSYLGMAAVAAVSLELVLRSLVLARFGWSFMLPTVAAALVTFAERGRLAGAAGKSLGARGLVLAGCGLLALAGGRWLVSPALHAEPHQSHTELAASGPAPEPPLAAAIIAAPAAPEPVASQPAPSIAAEPPSPDLPLAASAAESAAAPAPAVTEQPGVALPEGASGQLQIDSITARGMLEADARGGITRRLDRLEACLAEPKQRQSGLVTFKLVVDTSGSVTFNRAIGGDLVDSPLAACLMPIFYKLGFATPAATGATVVVTLRSTPR